MMLNFEVDGINGLNENYQYVKIVYVYVKEIYEYNKI